MRSRRTTTILALAFAVALAPGGPGCGTPNVSLRPVVPDPSARAISPNPLFIPTRDFDFVWNRTIEVLDLYFDNVATENRLTRKIVTDPKMGATLLEPWHGDSVGFRERLESTLQTIRRFAEVTVTDAPGGYLVQVKVYKELEDLVKPERQAGGRAVFDNQYPISMTREIIGPVPVPVGWIPRGRDTKLEQRILTRLRDRLFL